MRIHAIALSALLASATLAPVVTNAASYTPLNDLHAGGFDSRAYSVSTGGSMKMESSVTAPIGGRIQKIHVPAREQIDAGDLLYTIVPA